SRPRTHGQHCSASITRCAGGGHQLGQPTTSSPETATPLSSERIGLTGFARPAGGCSPSGTPCPPISRPGRRGRRKRARGGLSTRHPIRGRWLVAAVCVVAAVVSVPATSACTVVVDQTNLVSDGNLSVDLAHPIGQTFTTGLGGDLVGIEMAPLLGRTA